MHWGQTWAQEGLLPEKHIFPPCQDCCVEGRACQSNVIGLGIQSSDLDISHREQPILLLQGLKDQLGLRLSSYSKGQHRAPSGWQWRQAWKLGWGH